MSQKSYFHNGTAAGDATEAPYDQAEFARLVQGTFADGAFVLPEQLNDLEVTAGAGRSVNVNSGRATIYGYWYENDASKNISLATNTSGKTRIDVIVVEIDTDADTAEAKVLQGVPEDLPAPPELNTCETLLQMPLAYVVVPDSYASVSTKYVLDQRRFADNVYHRNSYTRQNDFPNGLFVAWCDSETSGTARRPMPGWKFSGVGTPQSVKDAKRFDSMLYGRCVQYYTAPSDSTEGFTVTVPTDSSGSQMFTLSFLLQVEEGYITVAFGAVSKEYVASSEPYQVIIRGSITGNKALTLSGTSGAAKFGDFRLAQGYCMAQQAVNGPQVVMFDKPVYMNLDWSASSPPTLTGLSTGAVGFNLPMFGASEDAYGLVAGEFSSLVKGIVFQLKVNDSGSAGTNPCYAQLITALGNYLRVDVSGITNDRPRYGTGTVYSGISGQATLEVDVVASGAGTLDVDLSVVGLIL